MGTQKLQPTHLWFVSPLLLLLSLAFTPDNDFALLLLSYNLTFSRVVQRVCLPPPGTTDQYAGVEVTVMGWGTRTAGVQDQPSQLYSVKLNTVTNKQCGEGEFNKPGYPIISSAMLCSSSRGKGSCEGDSGGVAKLSSSWLVK